MAYTRNTRNEEQIQFQQMAKERQAEFYRLNPELKAWENRKRRILYFVEGYWVLHMLFLIIFNVQSGLGGETVKILGITFFQVILLNVFIGPKSGWQLNVMLYVWTAYNFVNFSGYTSNIRMIFQYFSEFPLYGIVVVMELYMPAIFLVIAIYYTGFRKNREMSEKISEFQKELLELAKQQGKQP